MKTFGYILLGIHWATMNLYANPLGKGKSPYLDILNPRPLNAQTPMHRLDDAITPTELLFVRNNGIPPTLSKEELSTYALTIDGEVENPLHLTLDTLKKEFKNTELQLVLECGGNGRAGFHPSTRGNQWTYGAVGCPTWKGVRLRDVLEKSKLKSTAVFVAYYGHDTHLSGDAKKEAISRGVPIAKALEPETLLAWEMNGKPLHEQHGYPLRLICPGYPGSVSGKWLKRLWVRDRVHDSAKMKGMSYRIPKHPVPPGTEVPEKDMRIIEDMPVKSLITFPKSQSSHSQKKIFETRGHAWSGKGEISHLEVSFDFGQTWIKATLDPPKNRFAWQRWKARWTFSKKGYYEIWAKATDHTGRSQPMIVPGWNPKGYLNNAMPRIAIQVI